MTRIGIGYDIHRLEENRPMVLGGVAIPSEHGAAGHSDADVLIHAIIDALLGASGNGDIGEHFPPSDPEYKDISSRILLKKIVGIIHQQGWHIENVDSTVILERPKLSSFKKSIRETLAEDLQISTGRVSIKAKTNEGLDSTGRGLGVEAHAVVLLSGGDPTAPPKPDDESVWV